VVCVGRVSACVNRGGGVLVKHLVGVVVPGATAEQFYDFMIDPNDEAYKNWWPEEHFQFHITKHGKDDHLFDKVYFDEKIGPDRRLKFHAIVITATRPNRIIWQITKAGIWMPAYLELRLIDSTDGVVIEHELKAGYGGIGKILDPIIKLYMNNQFLKALEEHCAEEWPKLAEYLNNQK